MGKQSSKTEAKRAVAVRAKTAMAKANPNKKRDERLKVAYKHKKTKGSEQWHTVNASNLVKASLAKSKIPKSLSQKLAFLWVTSNFSDLRKI